MMNYQKFIYWLDPDRFLHLKATLKERGNWRDTPQKAVCVPLTPDVKFGYVLPETWKTFGLCKRQLSWYATSIRSGLVLVVSDHELEGHEDVLSAIIRPSAFELKTVPDEDEKLRLIASEAYQRQKPAKWEDIASEYPGKLDKWMKIMGLEDISFEALFITHCANHANFIDPVYVTGNDSGPIPYSIDKTKFICSACLEIYNIIGENHHKKLVVPCPGAVKFAGLPRDCYFEVVSME